MQQKRLKFGLFIGRFQPFHLGHLSDIKKILAKTDFLVICIGSAQEKRTEKNPLSAAERRKIIKHALNSEKISSNRYAFINISDVGDHNLWVKNLIKLLDKLQIKYKNKKVKLNKNNTHIFAGNEHSGHFTLYLLSMRKYKVIRMKLLKGISGTKIRQLIAAKKPWQHLVPKSVAVEIERAFRKL